MLGNFDFMFGDDRREDYANFAVDCERAERLFAEGEYEPCMMYCRKSAELIVRWLYCQEELNLPDTIDGMSVEYVSQKDRLNQLKFVSWFKNPTLREELHWVRRQGNDAIHDHQDDPEYALRGLKAVFALVELVEMRLWEEPYIYEFFEPCFDPEPEDAPEAALDRDYTDLIREAQENGDHILAAKWALLLKADRPSFDLAPYKAPLPENAAILQLISAIEDKRVLRSMLQESTIKLSSLVRKCYEESGFDWRETYAITYMAAKACRAMTAASANGIEQCLKKMNAEVSHG